jgi:gamma-glutamyltranspeptidase/glutathione hydrolase
MMRDFQQPGRSEALGTEGMVAASHPAASLAAYDVLRAGGNAVDAAICASAVLAVVEPTQTGIGGDCFALLMRDGDPIPVAMNGSGWAPADATPALFGAEGAPIVGANAVTVPGAVAAWERLLADYGTFEFARVLAPAIHYATDGYIVTERLARDWMRQISKLQSNEAAAACFLRDGKALAAGDRHRQPRLAEALRSIARAGATAMYDGWIADDIIASLRELGGIHRPDDFAELTPEYVTPISTAYRGYDLWECPPNGQGLVPLIMANVIEGFDLAAMPAIGAERYHLQAEVSRLAYAERDAYIADPRNGSVPVAALLSAAHADDLRARISRSSRISPLDPPPLPEHRDTVYLAVVDRDGLAVSFINSIYDDFGGGIVAKESGIVLHNRGEGFVRDAGHPNVIAGRKRPMHTIIPAILAKRGNPIMPFGVTGAHFQPAGQMQLLSNLVDYGMSVQAAIDQPRMFARGDSFELETTVPESVVTNLRALGHRPTRAVNPLGTAQAVWIDRERGLLRGGADSRRDGIALGW